MSEAAPVLQCHLSYEMANNDVHRFFSMLYSPYMQYYPKRRSQNHRRAKNEYDTNRPWVFIGPADKMKSVATLSTLFAYLDDPDCDTTYFTPASFYQKGRRLEEAARWIHAITLDIDVKGKYSYLSGITLIDVLDRIEAAGLPNPTIVVKTPSGGFQPTWVLSQPIRATEKTRILFKIIHRFMATEIDADLQATGVQNIYRTPTEQALVFFQAENTYLFQQFIDWRDINHPRGDVKTSWRAVGQTNIMDHPAIEKLLTQPAVPTTRDNSCLTLALAMKFSGHSLEQAETMIEDWFGRCVEQGGKTPLTIRKALSIVSRVYASDKFYGPSPTYIKNLTGIAFSYDDVRYLTAAKPREERTRSHLTESKADLLDFLNKQESVTGTLKSIATELNLPESTLKLIIRDCEREGDVTVTTVRGRNGSTTITRIRKPVKPKKKAENKGNVVHIDFKNKQRLPHNPGQLAFDLNTESGALINSYTHNTIDRAGGGAASPGLSDPDPPG